MCRFAIIVWLCRNLVFDAAEHLIRVQKLALYMTLFVCCCCFFSLFFFLLFDLLFQLNSTDWPRLFVFRSYFALSLFSSLFFCSRCPHWTHNVDTPTAQQQFHRHFHSSNKNRVRSYCLRIFYWIAIQYDDQKKKDVVGKRRKRKQQKNSLKWSIWRTCTVFFWWNLFVPKK